jgi:pyruvate dehydrogenase E2 component (dihydrolipoamide acetyltransferase)
VAIEVLMPVITQLGDDGVVTAWMVDEGGVVKKGQLIAEVQAEKVAEDIHAPADGVVRQLVAINDPVPQGGRICVVAGTGEVEAPQEMAPAASAPILRTERPAASPAARRRARELGVDLTTVTGTGPDGRITESDIDSAAGSIGELSGLRAVIARNMRESARSTAAVTLTTTADVTGASEKSVTAWVVSAVARALLEHPHVNGTRDGDRFVPGGDPAIALAIQTDDGLVAPVVRGVVGRTIEEVAADIADLAGRARARRLFAGDYEGGTFSVTNLGSYGVDGFSPIINPPQLAILGVGALRTVPGFDSNGSVVALRVLTLSLTFDHAFVDGAPAAAFLATVRGLLEETR